MQIPSRIGGYNKEYYPAFVGSTVSNTAPEWLAGTDKEPVTMTLEPAGGSATTKGLGGLSGLSGLGGAPAASASAPAAAGEDVAALKKQIEDLKAELAASQAASSAASSGPAAPAEDLSTKPTLGYWRIRGLAQPIRVMLAYCGVDFEDTMYDVSLTEEGWDRSAWTNVKFSLGMDYPNLPYLIDGETKLTETAGIMRYIAKKWDPSLLGSSAAQLGKTEMLFAHVMKMKELCTLPCYMGQKQGEELKDQIAEDCQPILEKIMEVAEGSAWLTGDSLTWLDFFFAEVVEYMEVILDERFVAQIPASHEYLEKFRALDKVKEFYSKEGVMLKPFNNKMAFLGQEE